MVRIELLEVKENIVRYKFFPESSEEYGIVALDRKTGERILEKQVDGYSSNYMAHAFKRLEECQKQGNFPQKDVVAWY